MSRAFGYAGHWLVRRADTPCWYIYWCRAGTRRVLRRSTGTADLEEAKRNLIAFAEERSVPITMPVPFTMPAPSVPLPQSVAAFTPPRAETGVPFLKVVSQYAARLEGRASHRLAEYCLEVWSEFCGYADLVYVHEFTLAMQDKFTKWRRASRSTGLPISNGTMNRFLEVARAAFHDGWKRGELASIPYVKLLPKPAPRDRFLTSDEVQRLLAACTEPHLRQFVLIALHTLQRPAAILDLRVEQVDLTWNRIDFLPRGRTQHNKRRPIIPITATLRPELERALDESVSGYVIELGGKPIKKLRHSFRTACTRAGIRNASPGVLRHTGATLLAAAGVPLREISGMLGHTTSHITEQVYAKRRPEFLAEAGSVLDRLFPEVQVACSSKTRPLLPKPLDSRPRP